MRSGRRGSWRRSRPRRSRASSKRRGSPIRDVVDHVTGTLLRRRELVLRAWLAGVNPVVNARVDGAGLLWFDNAAVDAGIAEAPDAYELSWFRFDNATGARSYVDFAQAAPASGSPVPSERFTGTGYAGVDIRTLHPDHLTWWSPVRVYFRLADDGWTVVGVDRHPDTSEEHYARR